MNIAVFVKASLNLSMIYIDSDEKINISRTPIVISEYDKNAIEEGVRLKEKYGGKLVVFSALTWGPIDKKSQDFERMLRECLAMGADEAHALIDENLINISSYESSIALAKLVNKVGNFNLFITGEGSMDTSSYQFASRLASHLNLPVITFVRHLEIEEGKIIAERDLEDEIQVVECNMPCIVSVTGEINFPRTVSVKQILQAKSKPILRYNIEEQIPRIEVDFEIKQISIKRKNVIFEGSIEEVARMLVGALIKEGILK
ncbi:MAG: electron transfer flavoprotein subunit beta/FixA family protein [Thermoproteota archaeon]|jgi:Electron transfer flavoprotein, beta subunit